MTNVTVEELDARGACGRQVDLFRAAFGDRVRVTRKALLKAADAGLDLEWFLTEFCPDLWAEYLRQMVALRDECDRQVAALWAEYDRQRVALVADLMGLR